MDLLKYLDNKYRRLGMCFYIKAGDNRIFCNRGNEPLFSIYQSPHYIFSHIINKTVPIDMLEYYEKEVHKNVLNYPAILRNDKLRKIKNRI